MIATTTNNTLNNYPQRTKSFKSSSSCNEKKYQSETKSEKSHTFNSKDKLKIGTIFGFAGGVGITCLVDEIHWWRKGKSLPIKVDLFGIGAGTLIGLLVGVLCCLKKTNKKD